MENSSHAIMIAGGMIIAMAIVGVLIFAFHNYSNYRQAEQGRTKENQVVEYNKKIESYHKNALKGTEAISLINLVANTNRKNQETDSDTGTENGGYPVIQVYIAELEINAQGSFVKDNYKKARRYQNYPYKSHTTYKGTIYGTVDTKEVINKGNGKIDSDIRDAYKMLYFQCDDITYDENGYVKEIYLRQIYDVNKNNT